MINNPTMCNVYIDEAGDLGIGKGTNWFILTGVVVDESDEPAIRKTIAEIKTKLNLQTLHFRELRNFDQKCYVVDKLAQHNFQIINIILDTTKLHLVCNNAKDKPSIVSYNYACRYLVERASWLLRDTNRVGKIVLSSRGTSRDNELIDYIKDKLLPYSYNKIAANVFTKVVSKQANSWDMLQLADICATSMFYAYELNKYEILTPCFAARLRKHFYTRNSALISYGIKYYSDEMTVPQNYFTSHAICKKA